jgi:hypothetical protein
MAVLSLFFQNNNNKFKHRTIPRKNNPTLLLAIEIYLPLLTDATNWEKSFLAIYLLRIKACLVKNIRQ